MSDRRIKRFPLIEVLVDGIWRRPIVINDHSDKGWIGYKLPDRKLGVVFQWRWNNA